MNEQTYFSTHITIPAGRTKHVNVQGNFVIILTNSSTTNPHIGIASQSFYELPAGVGVPYPDGFTAVFFKNPSAGVMTLFVAICIGQIQDTRVNVDALLQDIRAELQGDTTPQGFDRVAVGTSAVQVLAANANRKGCSVQAQWNNSGIVFIGFDNTVTATKYADNFAAGEGFSWDDYRGDVYAIGSAAGQYVGYGEW